MLFSVPEGKSNVQVAYPTWTTSNESIPKAFRPITQVESSGTDKVGAVASWTYIAAN